MMITAAALNSYLGKNISTICPNGYAAPDDNHCAHFVSHAMGYTFGYTCRAAMPGATGTPANLRVHEVFGRCPTVGCWADKPVSFLVCLVFVTASNNVNVAAKTMTNVPKKHIGIYIGGTIWHYSNSQHKVITQTPAEFQKHYPGTDIALFYGQII